MRLSLSLIVAGAFALAQPLAAQVAEADSGDVSVNGSVAPLCVLGSPNPNVVDLGQLIDTSGTRIGRITALPNRQVSLAGSFCNFAGSMITVEVEALVLSDNVALQPGFARAVNYTASVGNWAATATQATSAASADGGTPGQTGSGVVQALPRLADISVTLSNFTAPADSLLVAGPYQGAVVITLGPAAMSGAN